MKDGIMNKNTSSTKLKFFRELSGYSMKEVGEKIDVSPMMISYWENGKKSLTFDKLIKLSKIYDIDHRFLLNNLNIPQNTEATFFRKKSISTKKQTTMIEHKIRFLSILDSFISNEYSLQYFMLKHWEVEKINKNNSRDSIKSKTKMIREKFDLETGPISNMTLLAEKMGIRVIFFDFKTDKIDAITEKIDDKFYIGINISNTTSVRTRFNIAHEIGHIFLHSNYEKNFINNTSNHRMIEDEANYFAGELLMPSEGIALDMSRVNMNYLIELKKHWKVSLQALIYRGNELGLITNQQALFLRQTIYRNNWSKNEPFDDAIKLEKPTLLNSVINYNNGSYSYILNNTNFKKKSLYELLSINEPIKKNKFHMHLI